MLLTAFSNGSLTSFDPTKATYTIGTVSGRCLKINNLSNRGISVMQSSIAIDYIPPYAFLVMDNLSELSLVLDSTATFSYMAQGAAVTVTTIDQDVPYQIGSLLQVNVMQQQQSNSTISLCYNLPLSATPATGQTSWLYTSPVTNVKNFTKIVANLMLQASTGISATTNTLVFQLLTMPDGGSPATALQPVVSTTSGIGSTIVEMDGTSPNAYWDSCFTPQMLENLPNIAFRIGIKNKGGAATAASVTVGIGLNTWGVQY